MTTPYDVITDRVNEKLEAGTIPWEKPWHGQAGMPKNLTSGKTYRGINPFLLHCLGYESPYFLTFQQCKERGGSVRKGERGCPVVFWKWFSPKNQPSPDNPDYMFSRRDENGRVLVPMLRYYTVFNVAQCDGVDAPALDIPEREHNPIETAETMVAGMRNAPTVRTHQRAASYEPVTDTVNMPRSEVFTSGEAYYSVLFHELTHSTGHTSRLNRKGITEEIRFGSSNYGKEELVAEMGSAFLCGETGILDRCIDRSAAYVEGWLKGLKNDRKLVVIAAAQAQKAADYILGRTFEAK